MYCQESSEYGMFPLSLGGSRGLSDTFFLILWAKKLIKQAGVIEHSVLLLKGRCRLITESIRHSRFDRQPAEPCFKCLLLKGQKISEFQNVNNSSIILSN